MKKYRIYALMSCLFIAGALGYGCALEATCDDNTEYADSDSNGKMVCKKFDAGHCGKSDKGGYVNCSEEGIPNAAGFLCVYDQNGQRYACEINKCKKGYVKSDDGTCSECEKGYHHPDDSDQCVLNNGVNLCGFSETNCNKYIANGRAVSVECKKKWEYGNIAEFGCNMSRCQKGYHLDYNELSEAHECIPDTTLQCGDKLVNCTDDPAWNKGNCIEGACIPTECAIGWYLDEENHCMPNDNANCGSKGNKCDEGFFCAGGECKNSCDPLTNCGGKCVDTTTDPSHCGTCDNDCRNSNNLKDPNIETYKCNNTQCEIGKCKSGYHIYGFVCEVDSNENCGAHGFACDTDDFSVCYAGAPLPEQYEYQIGDDDGVGFYADQGGTGSCYVKPGQVCENGRCVSKNTSVVIGAAEIEDPSTISDPGYQEIGEN